MAGLRKLLMYCSLLSALSVFSAWILFYRNFDILTLGFIGLFAANAFYIYFSRPTVQTSGILAHASSRLSLASLELIYLSEEAKSREAEYEKILNSKKEQEKYKLQVAQDMLRHLQFGTTVHKGSAIGLLKAAHNKRSEREVLVESSAAQQAVKVENSRVADPPFPRDREVASSFNVLAVRSSNEDLARIASSRT